MEVLSSLILGNTGKLNFSSMKMCKRFKKKKSSKLMEFSEKITSAKKKERGGSSFVQNHVLCGLWREFGESDSYMMSRISVNMLKQTCGYMETKKTFESLPCFKC